VGAEQAELAADPGRIAADRGDWRVAAGGIQQVAEVAVAEAGAGELAAGDGLEQREVVRFTAAPGANPTAAIDGRRADASEEEDCGLPDPFLPLLSVRLCVPSVSVVNPVSALSPPPGLGLGS
jgi:hypothetical protein